MGARQRILSVDSYRTFASSGSYRLMEDAIYGGRVDNPYDVRVLKAYLRKIFNDSVFEGRCDLMKGLTIPQPCTYDEAVAAVGQLGDGTLTAHGRQLPPIIRVGELRGEKDTQ